MSDMMLHAVLEMPINLWEDTELDKVQRHSRYIEASARIEADEKLIERLLVAINTLRKAKGRYHSEQAYNALMATAVEVDLAVEGRL